MTLTTGQLLAGRYLLGRRIAVGGMGEVWEAADNRLDRRVAVKVLKLELSTDAEFLHRFRVEARTTASLNHPGIAAVHDYGETSEETAYLVMELVAGEPLAALLSRQRRLSPEYTLDILEQAGNALQAAHERGLVHRDVKPGNILLTPTGTVKITDFGIAKAVDAAPVTRSGMVMGTAHYIAPEQAAGSDAGPASDVYSLGVVGYECLGGQRPFRSDNALTVAMMHIRDAPPPLPPDVPHGVRSLVEATLVKDPRQRYGNGGELVHAVRAVRAGQRLPVPVGMAGTAATALLAGGYPATQVQAAPQPQTALLPPGGYTGPQQQYPPTGPYGSGAYPAGGYPPPVQRRGGWVLGALLLLAALAVAGYAVYAALADDGGPPAGAAVSAAPTAERVAPAEPAPEPPPQDTPEPAPPPEQAPPEENVDTVTVDATDYLGDTAKKVTDALEDLGLDVRVQELGGSEGDSGSGGSDSDDEGGDDEGGGEGGGGRGGCRVVDVSPSGEIPADSTVTITCVGGS